MNEITCAIQGTCVVEATILASVNCVGNIDCIEYSNYNVITHNKAEAWKRQKLETGEHTFTYIKVKLPYPINNAEELPSETNE